jgi:hypothetical protein
MPKAKGKAKVVDDVIEVEEPPKQRSKRKASSREEEITTDVEVVPSPAKSKKGPSRAASETRGTAVKSKPGREAHRGGSVQPTRRPDEDAQVSDTADTAPKKKKRKINLFPTNAQSTAFNFTPQV